YGIIYNKDMFTEVGFDEPPKTISEFKELCEALKSIGITPLGFGFKEGWIMSQFLVFPFGSDSEFPSVTDDIKSGKKVLKDIYFYQNYKDFADLCLANCQDKVLEGDYTTQVTLFAAGEVAMITNGDWTAGMITEITPDINMGIMGMPYTDKAEDYKIPVSASNCMGYFKDSAAPEEAIKFIEWLVTTDEGKDWIGNDWKMATPVKNVNGELNVLSQDGMTAVEKGYSCSWGDVHFPGESYASYSIEFQKYILGETDWDTMLDAMSAEIVNYASK
ncbi:MAG: extracellular solute-binding protein, partial [Clostridiales bacterium]|nr:extracellular solute-binding protein [Clostridiales bacterium]